jgi:transcriptional regulator with XRE-family HTH domain/DNA-binding transcriptional regulator LsrR (DeoR family)
MTRRFNDERIRMTLRERRKAKGWTQEELGKKLERTKVTIAEWEGDRSTTLPSFEMLEKLSELYDVELETLLGFEADEVTGDVRWRSVIPDYPFNMPMRAKAEAVVDAFREMLKGQVSLSDLNMQFGRLNTDQLAQMLSIALRNGILRIQSVQTDESLADKLFLKLQESKFNIFEVTVVKTQKILIPHITASMVALAAAKQFTPRVVELARETPRVNVGMGHGYTMTRIGEMVYSPLMAFNNLEFVPLIASDSIRRVPSSASYNTAIFSRRFFGSGSLVMEGNLRDTEGRFPQPQDMSMVIATARPENPYSQESRSVGNKSAQSMYLNDDDGRASQDDTISFRSDAAKGAAAVHEFAGWRLDSDGKIRGDIGSKAAGRYPFKGLQEISRYSESWLVASGRGKQDSVMAAIRAGLVNKLIIDDEIATHLLTQLSPGRSKTVAQL